ncbi:MULTISPECIES: SpoIIE family protein phosphatase [unclassified Blastococcus]|uniref:SpoIIE family protein phosphatase n=1 Tax=unclassified Blastococcus TaxID=2619396 RepID=UPI002815A1B9|nr:MULTISPECIES: SpoIIE family protein phosphatase [unclassified Blastococcus]
MDASPDRTTAAGARPAAGSSLAEVRAELAALQRRYENERLRWELAKEAGEVGTFDFAPATGKLLWDEQLQRMFGYDPSTFTESLEAFTARVHPDDEQWHADALQAAVDTVGEYDVEYRIVLPDGETRWIHARGRHLPGPDGRTDHLIGAAYDTTGEREVATRVTRLLEAMPAGFYSLDPEWRFTHVNAQAERLLGQSRDELLGQIIWEAFPATVGGVFEESYRKAVSSGEPVAFDAYYPAPLDGWFEVRAWPTPDGLSVYFLEVTERRQAQERAERSARQLAILAQVSAELASTLDTVVAAARIPRLVVPALADFCLLTVIGEDGAPRDVGSWHVDPRARPLLERYREVRLAAMPMTAPVARALHTGEAATFRGRDVLTVLADGPARELLTLLAPSSEVALPLRARGRTVGLLTLFYAEGNSPSADDVTVAQEVADRAGLALDNARLFSAQQQLAEGLQRSMLTEPPEPDHAEIAVRYLPAAEAARVGGDWYDAFLQPCGTTMLVIGDVVGHDTEAAAAMGQLRSLLRGIATYSDAAPVEVLRGLDAAMATLQVDTLATAAVARFEQTPEEVERGITRMRWANAGHLPPLVANPDGSVAELAPWVGDLMLGVDATTDRHESVVALDRGSTVLLYTDGLVERRDADLDQGLLRLRDELAQLADRPLGELLDELIERLVQGRPEDDVALVAVRLHPQDRPRPAVAGPNRVPPTVPPDPAEA